MKKIIGIIVGGVILVFLVLGILRTQQKEEVKSISGVQREEGIPVLAQEVERGAVQSVRNFYGTVEARNQALVSSKLMERIEEVKVAEGDRVAKGDILVRFDRSANPASVQQARLQYENARRDYERMKELYEEGAISKQTLDQVKLGYEMAEENYKSARQTVDLLAPIPGIVARVEFEAGQIAYPGDVVVTIVDTSAYQVEFDVTQEDRHLLHAGLPVRVLVRNEEKPLRGTVRIISLASSVRTRLFTAYADLQRGHRIYPGVLATVEVVVAEEEDALTVPTGAVVEIQGEDHVWVVNDSTAAPRRVSIGLRGEGRVVISDGLSEGETIVTYGMNALEEGARVKIVTERAEATGGAES